MNFLSDNSDLIKTLIAIIALVFSVYSILLSKKLEKKQIFFVERTVPTLFFKEISNHLSTLIVTLDTLNPTWICRGSEGKFNLSEFIHKSLNTTTYDSYIDKIHDINLRITLDNYYSEVSAFNLRGTELSKEEDHGSLNFRYYVEGGAILIRTAYTLCDELLKIIDKDVKKTSNLCLYIENVNERKNYGLTVANVTGLTLTEFKEIYSKIATDGIESIDCVKYPTPNYICELHEYINS